MKVYAREDSWSSGLKPILCHSLVLCSVAPSFKTFLTDPDVEKDEDDFKVVLIPDLVRNLKRKSETVGSRIPDIRLTETFS